MYMTAVVYQQIKESKTRLLVDDFECSLFEFIKENYIDEQSISEEEYKNLIWLRVGQTIPLGLCHVTRII